MSEWSGCGIKEGGVLVDSACQVSDLTHMTWYESSIAVVVQRYSLVMVGTIFVLQQKSRWNIIAPIMTHAAASRKTNYIWNGIGSSQNKRSVSEIHC